MTLNPASYFESAQHLMRRGLFSDAACLLQREATTSSRQRDPRISAVLADALQRIGHNDQAHAIATDNIARLNARSPASALYHFVLGNIARERGMHSQAAEHFQIAASLAGSDNELACWSQLRLVHVIAEVSGPHAALSRLDETRRALARFGDARAFAALHLWLVEIESTRGNLHDARRHLTIAESLLANIEDAWLTGYLAINSSALHYYSANTPEARRCALEAVALANKSGHRHTLLAAHANLGSIELSLGGLPKAETYFNLALRFCETGSISEIAILDNIAHIHLQTGNIDRCRTLVARLETLIEHTDLAKRRHYIACALFTKTRLLLREGNVAEALTVSTRIKELITDLPLTRMTTEAHLLCTETLLSAGDPRAGAISLMPLLGGAGHFSPDMFARLEQVMAKTLASSLAVDLVKAHLHRAAHTFSVLGHSIGSIDSHDQLHALPATTGADTGIACQLSLDRIRALLDLRSQPELFGHEAATLLRELNCAHSITLRMRLEANTLSKRDSNAISTPGETSVSIQLSPPSSPPVALDYTPYASPQDRLTAATFHKVITHILAIPSIASVSPDVAWNSDGGSLIKDGAVFASDAMLNILKVVKQVAPTDASVLITGETGTGKEVIARTLHEHSRRSAVPLLALNCAAVPRDLIESQLFGHKKGAFSGAAETYLGIVRAANGGTLFLDEIGELPLEIQAKLLRFLEMNEVHPIGEPHPVKVNVRLVFATNGDLEEAVAQNRFRGDLFYRLNVIPIRVPPLRQRREEIPVLANLFAKRFAVELSKRPIQISTAAMERLILHPWPGNIRELANEVRRLAVLKASGAVITPDQLSPALQSSRRLAVNGRDATENIAINIGQSLESAMILLETQMIKHALEQAHGNVSRAAEVLGISRKGLYLKRQRLKLT